MKWKNKHINIGEIKVNKKKTITFEYLEELPLIRRMVSTCGCSNPKRDGNKIVVTFTAPPLQVQSISKGYQNIIKQVKITYMDGTQDILSFTAKVIKN